MKEWKYLVGSADDFIGAPEWATEKRLMEEDGFLFWLQKRQISAMVQSVGRDNIDYIRLLPEEGRDTLVAQRTESFGNAIDLEFCKANPDHPDCKCKESRGEIDAELAQLNDDLTEFIFGSKYSRPCKGVNIDVYDVLQAFAVTNPATQHAIKKLLCAGLRGHKDKMQDLTEALKSIERAIELEKH